VDDAVASVMLLESILQRLGFKQVRTLTDARQAFATCADWKPDLVLLDLAMPHISGLQVLQRLREQETAPGLVPVMVLTANADPETKRKALLAGATEFMSKPFDTSEIILRIRNVLVMTLLQSELRNQNQLLEQKVAERTKVLSERTAELERTLAELKATQKQLEQQERFRATVIEYTGSMLKNPVHEQKSALSLRILTVDDDQESRDLVERYLQNDGHEAVSVGNGREALAKLLDQDFDLVITDHAMPGMTGTQLATVVNGKWKKPVILMTSSDDPGFSQAELPHGVHALLHKVFSQKELRRAIDQVLGPL
jgi:CheY-like chemotaxis protein